MRSWKFLLPLLTSTLCFAAQSDRISGPIDSTQRITLPGHIHRKALPQYDQGRIEPSFQFGYITMLLTPSASQLKAMDLLAAQQQDRTSPNFHKWLTPEQFSARFGQTQNDMQKITGWLTSQNLRIVSVARGGQFVIIGGNAAQVENAFQTEIHRYNVDGEMHFANATMPSVPAALSGVIGGFRGLNDFRLKPALKRHPDYTVSGSPTHFLAPGDLYTIYDIAALHTAGFDGTGQKIAILGQTDLLTTDINDYRTDFGLPAINLQQVLVPNTGDPGVVPGDLGESDLDLELSGAIAPNAKIIFVFAGFSGGGMGVFSATQHAIDNLVAPVISVSYGNCELGSTDSTVGSLPTQDLLFKQAAMQGISFFASTGDDGPATCDINDATQPTRSAIMGLAVDYPASSQYVTGVGGTEFNEGSGNFWGSTNNAADGGSALSYIPEISWNDYAAVGGFLDGGGGGPSNCANQTPDFFTCISGFTKPSWQTGPGVPADGVRDVPDVSFSASNVNDPYIVCMPLESLNANDTGNTTSSCANGIAGAISQNSAFGGTSASAPLMAGIAVLLNQYLAGSSAAGLGNINPMLYSLASNSPSAFHDTPAGSDSIVNCTPGTPSGQPAGLVCPSGGTFGFSTTTGYDLVTGLGSVDANALAVAWKATLAPDFQFTASALNPSPVPAGQSTSATLTISPVTGSTGTVVNFSPSSCTGLPTGATCSFNPASVTFDGTNNASTTLTISTLANMAPSGPQTVTITPTSSSNTTTTVSLTVTATTETFTLTTTGGAVIFPVAVGGTTQVGITVNSTTGFINNSNSTTALPLTYTCTGSPSLSAAEISCQLPNNGQPDSASAVTISLVTTPVTAQLRPLGRRIFYALLLPGLLGIVFAAGSRTRGLRLLSLIVVLGFSTLWLGACGGGSNNNIQKNPGTPPGMYTVTISATTGGANPVTNSNAPFTITLNVTAH